MQKAHSVYWKVGRNVTAFNTIVSTGKMGNGRHDQIPGSKSQSWHCITACKDTTVADLTTTRWFNSSQKALLRLVFSIVDSPSWSLSKDPADFVLLIKTFIIQNLLPRQNASPRKQSCPYKESPRRIRNKIQSLQTTTQAFGTGKPSHSGFLFYIDHASACQVKARGSKALEGDALATLRSILLDFPCCS